MAAQPLDMTSECLRPLEEAKILGLEFIGKGSDSVAEANSGYQESSQGGERGSTCDGESNAFDYGDGGPASSQGLSRDMTLESHSPPQNDTRRGSSRGRTLGEQLTGGNTV